MANDLVQFVCEKIKPKYPKKVKVFKTIGKGWGLKLKENVKKGQLILE